MVKKGANNYIKVAILTILSSCLLISCGTILPGGNFSPQQYFINGEEYRKAPTRADGNCFMHAAFGEESFGQLVCRKADEIRMDFAMFVIHIYGIYEPGEDKDYTTYNVTFPLTDLFVKKCKISFDTEK